MSRVQPASKAELIDHIEPAWEALHAFLDSLTEEQMTALRDAEGWSVKDHVLHMMIWERSVAFVLQGKPRHEGLEITKELYAQSSDDEINAVVQRRLANMAAADALATFRAEHRNLLESLEAVSDGRLLRPYRELLPDGPGRPEDRSAMELIYVNTAHHFAEHLGWMKALVGKKK